MTLRESPGVGKRFGPTVALDGVTFEVRGGRGARAHRRERRREEHPAQHALGGLLAPDGGSMRGRGDAVRAGGPRDARARGIALIHQELSLFPHLTRRGERPGGRRAARVGWLRPRASAPRTRRACSAEFGHAETRPRSARGRPLPRRAAGRRDLPRRGLGARVLLMDEPTSSLQRQDVERLFALIRRLAGARHRRRLHQPLPRGDARDRLGLHGAARRPHAGRRRLASVIANDELIAQMVGRTVSELYPGAPRQPAEKSCFEVRGLVAPPGLASASFVAAPRRDPGHRSASWARAARRWCARSSASAARRGRPALARPRARDPGGRRRGVGRAGGGHRLPERGPQGRGPRAALSVADNVTLTRLVGLRPRRLR